METPHKETDLGRTLFELREGLGWSQTRLHRESGVSRVTLSKLETGQITTPKMETLRKLARALGVPVEDLLHPKDERPSPEAPEEYEGQPMDSTAEMLDRVTEEVLEPLIRQRRALIKSWRDRGVDALQEARTSAFEWSNSTDAIYYKLQRLGADEVIENRATASIEDLDAAVRQVHAFRDLRGTAAEADNVVRELLELAGDEAEGGFEAFEEMLAAAQHVEAG